MHSDVHSGIRRAVAAGEFSKASVLWDAYAEQLAKAVRGGAGTAAELTQMRELIDWTRGVVTCARAQAQRRINNRLTGLHVATAYARQVR